MTRFLPLALLVSLAGCAGHVADYVGPRAGIVSPQLIRYGLSLDQSRCVGEQLGLALRPLQLRLFARAAGAVQRGYFEPARLTMRDLLWVATSMGDPGVASALERANAGCGVAIVTGDAPPLAVPAAAPAAPRASAWLNLGAAGSGQSIAIDASTIEQEGRQRSAWFRLTDPGAAPSPDSFQLDIDCARRTINPKARRRRDAAGAIADYREYPANPLPVEGGTVMEIAFLSLCT
ncbi:MAG TPA: hypothetical protein VES64_09325 [Allosphingosinicella sp.]|nr:hypothetical protein [Allosphingosinicella sp.]